MYSEVRDNPVNSEENYHILLIINHDLTQMRESKIRKLPKNEHKQKNPNNNNINNNNNNDDDSNNNNNNKEPCIRETSDHNSTWGIRLIGVLINIWLISVYAVCRLLVWLFQFFTFLKLK